MFENLGLNPQQQAIAEKTSDIHIERYDERVMLRFRIHGTLYERTPPSKDAFLAVISRIKILSKLDIAEKRLPQDGRISLRIGGRAVDVRVSTLPSAHGERAVLRLLDKSESKLSLPGLGMEGDTLARLQRLIAQPHGIILVTGPTGSGKTTTLYAALQQLDTHTRNILTVEDPVEYVFPGINQMLSKIAEGIAVEGMESLTPALVDRLVPITSYLPEGSAVALLSPERIATRAINLTETNREFLHAAWNAASAGAQSPIDLSAGDFLTVTELRTQYSGGEWWTFSAFQHGPDASEPLPEELDLDERSAENVAARVKSDEG